MTIDEIRLQFTTSGGVGDADVSGALWLDNDADGIGDFLLEGPVAAGGGMITFINDFVPSATQNFVVVVTVDNLLSGDTTTFSLDAADIDVLEVGAGVVGSTTSAVHTQDPSPDLTQIHYRWRNDDGGEAAATWAKPQDTKLIGVAEGSPRRLRFEVSNEGLANSGPVAYQLQVAETASCSTGTYTPVPTDISGDWQIIDSAFITDGEVTTNVVPGLADEASLFISGEVRDAADATGPITLNVDQFTEIEFSLQAISNATRGGNYCFRLFDVGTASPLANYMVYAEVSVSDATLTLADHDVGQVPDQFSTSPSVITELFRFKLSAAGTGSVTVNDIEVHFTTTGGVVNGDVTAGELWRNENDDGVIDGGDTPLQVGVTPSGGVLGFTGLGEPPGTGTNYIVRATASNLVAGDTTTFSLDLNGVDLVESGVGEFRGYVRRRTHPRQLGGGRRLLFGGYLPCDRHRSQERCAEHHHHQRHRYPYRRPWRTFGFLIRLSTTSPTGPPMKPIKATRGESKSEMQTIRRFGTTSSITLPISPRTRTATPWESRASIAGKTHYIYNNTVFRVLNAASVGSATGIADTPGATMWVRNNYVGLADSPSGAEACFSGPFAAENNNVSSDLTAAGPGSQVSQSVYADYFFDATFGIENLHLLASSNSLWGSFGADLDTDPNLPVVDDIDGQLRDPSTPDIGPDEALNTNYRSIGIAPDYVTGTIDATGGSPVVMGTGTNWQTANRGRGDVITFPCPDPPTCTGGTDYTILSVDSETKLTLTEPVAGNFTGTHKISRQFTTLQAWEDCISGAGGCTYFPVASGDLVSEHRKEIGIAYNDSAVPTDPDFVKGVEFQDSTTDPLHAITLTANQRNRHYGQAGGGVLVDSLTASDTEDEIRIRDDNVTVEWLEIRNVRGASTDGGVKILSATDVLLRFLLVHDNSNGIRLSGTTGGRNVTVRNSFIYNKDGVGIEGDNFGDDVTIENVSLFGNAQGGIDAEDSDLTVRNTISMNAVPGRDFDVGLGTLTQGNNISADGTAVCGGCLPNRTATDVLFPGAGDWVIFEDLGAGTEDFHLQDNPIDNDAQDNGIDLSGSFVADIDGGARTPAWDIGADDIAATTAIELVSFDATAGDGEALLEWETGSEVDNVGFYLYRATSDAGPFELVNPSMVPGLGSSPLGASYRYASGRSYFRSTY